MAQDPKMPPRDEKELDRIRALFEKGLSDAAKDPEKYMYLRRHRNQMIKPWEDYLRDWDPKKKDKAKEKEAALRVAAKFAAQADLDDLSEALSDLESLSDNLTGIEDAFDAHFKG